MTDEQVYVWAKRLGRDTASGVVDGVRPDFANDEEIKALVVLGRKGWRVIEGPYIEDTDDQDDEGRYEFALVRGE